MTKPFFVKFGNIWKKIPYWDQRSIEYQNQVQNPSNDHNKIEFWNGLLYYDGILYVLDGPGWLQVL
jgi:hypothetical protein